jgi:maltose O-acetyltransferase
MTSKLLAAYQRCRIIQFRLFSDCPNVTGSPRVRQPVQMVGKGRITFGTGVTLGWYPSPHFLSGYIYIEARRPGSSVEIGDDVTLSNNVSLVSDGPGIVIGKSTMIGAHVSVIDSDFHDLDIDAHARRHGQAKTGKVVIGENVGIGGNVRILRGAEVGSNSIIADGSLVIGRIPENVVAMGQPARVIFRRPAKN